MSHIPSTRMRGPSSLDISMPSLPETRILALVFPFATDTFEMFDECKDGLVLAKLINDSVPDTIDERVLNRPGKKIKSSKCFPYDRK